MKPTGILWGSLICIAVFLSNNADAQEKLSYKGNSLATWMTGFSSTNGNVREDARQAILQFGTNAVPYLMSETRALGRLQEEDKTNFDRSPALRERHANLRRAFAALGPVAKPAVSEMTSLLDNGTCPQMAGEMLALVDTNAASRAFIQAMTNKQLVVRIVGSAYLVMVGLGTNADMENTAVTELIECLNYESSDERAFLLRSGSAGTLGYLRLKPEVAVPALIERLQREKQAECRIKITKALGEYGKQAEAALPVLRQMTNDSDAVVKYLAVKSVKQIEGKSP